MSPKVQREDAMRQGAMSATRPTDDVQGGERAERAPAQGGREPRRLFADEEGVLWTAELRRPRIAADGSQLSPLILFWSDTRACLATLRSSRPITELSEEELRRHLRACLTG